MIENSPEPAAAAHAFLTERLLRPPFHGFLTPDIVALDAAGGEVRLVFRHRQAFQRSPDRADFHGGVLAACVDITGHAALAAQLLRPVPTIDMRVDYLRPAVDTDLHTLGRVVRAGNSVGIVDVEIAGDDGRVLVLGRCLVRTAA